MQPLRTLEPTWILPAFIAALVAACAGDAPEPTRLVIERDTIAGVPMVRSQGEPPHWPVTRTAMIGGASGAGPTLFGRIVSVAADADGRIYVADGIASDIRVFDATGSYVATFGRHGSGPGEYGRLRSIGMLGDTLLALDDANVRIGLLDLNGEWLGQWRYAAISGNGLNIRHTGTHTAAIPAIKRDGDAVELVWVAYDHTGAGDSVPARPAVAAPENGPRTYVQCDHDDRSISFFDVSFAPRAVRAPAPGGGAVASTATGYRLTFTDPTGDTTRVVERVTDEAAVTDADWAREMASFDQFKRDYPGGRCEPSSPDRPGSKRLIASLFFDDAGRLWVERLPDAEPDASPAQPATAAATAADNAPSSEFDVFSADGALEGHVTLPRRVDRVDPYVRGDNVYIVTADSLDIQAVQAFRFQVRRR